ncbi:MAG: RNA polymerase sigma factor [Bacteroidota bacterium]
MTTLEFNSAVIQNQQLLKPLALKLTRDVEDANDLIQDTFVKAISNRDKFTEGTNLKAWLYTIMKNTFITNYHRLVKRKSFIDTSLQFSTISDYTTDNLANSSMTLDEIHKAVDSLNYEYRTPFLMYFRGYKYYEIADILDIPIGTVKNRIHIARKILKAKLKNLTSGI